MYFVSFNIFIHVDHHDCPLVRYQSKTYARAKVQNSLDPPFLMEVRTSFFQNFGKITMKMSNIYSDN